MSTQPRQLYVAEPPAKYLVRLPVVVDCSVIAGLIFQEHWQAEAQARIADRSLHAPHLLDAEIAQVALKKHRSGATELAAMGLVEYSDMIIITHPVKAVESFDLATRYNLSAYDAAYLWLAAKLKAPLATFDAKLGEAARLHLSSLS
ncbi:MAG TPA: type II toxin-antitoxin system VapC family toxin [Casimicrobium huifangae]|jgi:predicted nucleic acid-binding protein|nr:type II toxin-antitoxin system VapC family toxin [Casimicrobium huifangae]